MPNPYHRLTGRRRTLLGYSQLWLGDDHILLVQSTRFAEDYRRFALTDIQAISVTDLPSRLFQQVAMAAAALAWTLSALAVNFILAKFFLAFTGSLALAYAVIDLARGDRCRCYLHTAVSKELLATVSRSRTAQVFLARVRPAIEAAQGRVTTEELAAVGIGVQAPVSDQPPELVAPRGYTLEILFTLFLVDAALIGLSVSFPNSEIAGALLTTVFAEVVLGIVALIRRTGRDRRNIAYAVIVVALFCVVADGAGLVGAVVNWFSQIVEAARQGARIPPGFVLAPRPASAYFAIGWRIAAGIVGLTSAVLERRTGRA